MTFCEWRKTSYRRRMHKRERRVERPDRGLWGRRENEEKRGGWWRRERIGCGVEWIGFELLGFFELFFLKISSASPAK